jgi:hypothetical protein
MAASIASIIVACAARNPVATNMAAAMAFSNSAFLAPVSFASDMAEKRAAAELEKATNVSL